MNISFSQLISGILARLRYGERPDPQRDWFVLITLAAILLAGVIGWNAWAFDTVAAGGVIGAATVAPPQAFNQSSLEAIQKIFTDRKIEEEKYTTGVYRFVDPSQ